jgi:ubiquinone/menaquinone biosynthesis C-methylase UbiE
VNRQHLDLCGSDEWADVVRHQMLPWVLEGVELGDDALEIGPGPGRTTDVLQHLAASLTVVEIDDGLAEALERRFAGTSVTVVRGDATELPFPDGRFSAAISCTMLHHVPSPVEQDAVLAQLARVVRPRGWVVGTDSLPSPELAAFHEGDTYVPIDPEGLAPRLVAAGLVDVEVITNEFASRFRGRVPD